jgi:hypothetical protein
MWIAFLVDPWTVAGTVFAGLAFAVVVWQEIRRWRLRGFPDLQVRPAPTVMPEKFRKKDELVRMCIRNVGPVAACDVLVLSPPDPEHGVRTVQRMSEAAIPAGGMAEFRCPDVTDETWFLISYRHPHRRARTIQTWLPAHPMSQLAVRRVEALAAPWWRRIEVRPARRMLVGPDRRVTASYRSDTGTLLRRQRRLQRKAERLGIRLPQSRMPSRSKERPEKPE